MKRFLIIVFLTSLSLNGFSASRKSSSTFKGILVTAFAAYAAHPSSALWDYRDTSFPPTFPENKAHWDCFISGTADYICITGPSGSVLNNLKARKFVHLESDHQNNQFTKRLDKSTKEKRENDCWYSTITKTDGNVTKVFLMINPNPRKKLRGFTDRLREWKIEHTVEFLERYLPVSDVNNSIVFDSNICEEFVYFKEK